MSRLPGVSSLGQTANLFHLSGPLLDDRMTDASFEEDALMAIASDYKIRGIEALSPSSQKT